eukprot:UN22853
MRAQVEDAKWKVGHSDDYLQRWQILLSREDLIPTSKISMEEVKRIWIANELRLGEIEEHFKRWDVNQDGHLSAKRTWLLLDEALQMKKKRFPYLSATSSLKLVKRAMAMKRKDRNLRKRRLRSLKSSRKCSTSLRKISTNPIRRLALLLKRFLLKNVHLRKSRRLLSKSMKTQCLLILLKRFSIVSTQMTHLSR